MPCRSSQFCLTRGALDLESSWPQSGVICIQFCTLLSDSIRSGTPIIVERTVRTAVTALDSAAHRDPSSERSKRRAFHVNPVA
jgi:hypothetical protein